MDDSVIYISRLTRLSLVGADGTNVGHVVDVVIDLGGRPPRVNGFVVSVGRRRVFVGAGRIGEITGDGLRLRRGSVNLRQFELRPGERLVVGELFGRRLREARVVDVGLSPAPEPFAWEVATVALGGRGLPGRRRPPEVLDWSEAGELLADERSIDREAATLGGLHPAEMAAAVRNLPLSRRRVLAEAWEDERLADLLEELSEDEQVRLVEGLDQV
jgi:sporulation protein YlmC with PRC-barrel domain